MLLDVDTTKKTKAETPAISIVIWSIFPVDKLNRCYVIIIIQFFVVFIMVYRCYELRPSVIGCSITLPKEKKSFLGRFWYYAYFFRILWIYLYYVLMKRPWYSLFLLLPSPLVRFGIFPPHSAHLSSVVSLFWFTHRCI